jgi:hypothetical protein
MGYRPAQRCLSVDLSRRCRNAGCIGFDNHPRMRMVDGFTWSAAEGCTSVVGWWRDRKANSSGRSWYQGSEATGFRFSVQRAFGNVRSCGLADQWLLLAVSV